MKKKENSLKDREESVLFHWWVKAFKTILACFICHILASLISICVAFAWLRKSMRSCLLKQFDKVMGVCMQSKRLGGGPKSSRLQQSIWTLRLSRFCLSRSARLLWLETWIMEANRSANYQTTYLLFIYCELSEGPHSEWRSATVDPNSRLLFLMNSED